MRDVEEYLGKVVLVGASWVDARDQVVRQREFYGVIESVEEGKSINLRLPDGELFELPPYISALQPAEPGEYRLQTTREAVNDPDFLVVWRFSEA